jgi:hypothetical protein
MVNGQLLMVNGQRQLLGVEGKRPCQSLIVGGEGPIVNRQSLIVNGGNGRIVCQTSLIRG